MIENRQQIIHDYLREHAGIDRHINDVVADCFADEAADEGEQKAKDRTSSALNRVSHEEEAVIRVSKGVYRYEPRLASRNGTRESSQPLYELVGRLNERNLILRDERGGLRIMRDVTDELQFTTPGGNA